jgi:hypothetical protein
MNLSRACGTFLALSFLTIHSFGNPVTLYPTASNFLLGDGGGGASAVLGGVNIEMFCVDFANPIYVPYGPPNYVGYTANESTITSGSNLSLTRFGGVSSWTAINISGDTTDTNTLNHANALARYQMAGYLTSLFHLQDNPVANAYNNGIQTAIWDLMDPSASGAAPLLADPTSALKSAATWLSGTSSSARDSFLANYLILSDTGKQQPCANGVGMCPFQEQITGLPGDPPPAVPEPRGQAVIMVGLLSICSITYRKIRCRA